MIRVMHIAQAAGGVERYLYTLLKNIDSLKFENILVCSQDYDVNKFEGIASEVVLVEMQRDINLLKEIRVIFKLRKIIIKYKPDIVYLHSSKAGAVGRLANLGIHNVSIYNAHGWAFNMKSSAVKRWLYAIIEKILTPFCTQIVAISEYERKSAINKKVCRKEKVQVIFNGVDFNEYNSTNNKNLPEITIPDDSFIVGCVGRLTIQKAPDIFIKAAKIIKAAIPNTYFLMVGDGEQRQEIEHMICDNKLDNCVFITGWVKNPLDYVNIMDVAMLLSRWEGFGLAVPEYMMLNKPVVATRADAIPDIVSEYKDGLLVNVDDYESAANAVILIHNDKKLAEYLRENGRKKVVQRFNADRVAKEHEEMFLRLTQTKS